MAWRLSPLFSGTELGEYYRWRLVVHLFAQRRSLLEGSVSLAAVLWVCRLRRGWPGFSWLIGLVAAITVARVALAWYFERSVVPGVAQARRTPEYWGWLFTAGAVATAVAWAVTDLCVIVGFNDPMLQMFVVMVQAGWVSAAGVRNAASPATVILQTCVPLASTRAWRVYACASSV